MGGSSVARLVCRTMGGSGCCGRKEAAAVRRGNFGMGAPTPPTREDTFETFAGLMEEEGAALKEAAAGRTTES